MPRSPKAAWQGTVVRLQQVPSTMDLARQAAVDGAATGSCFVAASQSAGRGRSGAAWRSQAGAGLYLSVLLWPSEAFPHSSLSPLFALAVAQASRALGAGEVQVKWPNDVLAPSGKLAGLLLERGSTPAGTYVLLGLGYNLRPQAVPATAGALPATSLAQLLAPGEVPSDAAVEQLLLAAIRQAYLAWQQHGFAPFCSAFDAHHALAGSDVVALGAAAQQQDVRGRALGIAEDGALVLQSAAGCVRVRAGEVRRVRADKSSQTVAPLP